jgi:hypothetical protein
MNRSLAFALVGSLLLATALACALPSPGTPVPTQPPPPASEVPVGSETPPETVAPPPETAAPPPEPSVVVQNGDQFEIRALDGTLLESRSASGLAWARQGVVQVVGDAIYYVDSGGSSLGGVVKRVTPAGAEELAFTAVPSLTSLTFAVSEDQSRIAWGTSTWSGTAPSSELWMANTDGSSAAEIVQSDPNDAIDDFYVLEAVQWTPEGNLIYAWQISGIGGYILFFGYSSFYEYNVSSGASTPLAPAPGTPGAPCWDAFSPDYAYVAGGCGSDGGTRLMVEIELATGTQTSLPAWPTDQGQLGAAAYSPSGQQLAYAIARGNMDDEYGILLVRPSRGAALQSLGEIGPGYIDRVFWADEGRLVIGYWQGQTAETGLITIDPLSWSSVGDGRPVGLMWP